MKNFVLLTLFLALSTTILISQNEVHQTYIATIQKDTLYWQCSDSLCVLMLHKMNKTQEKMLAFGESKPTRKIQDIKLNMSSCGILFERSLGHSYFLLVQKDNVWKIVTTHSWYDYMTSAAPSEILSINLDAVNQITVTKTENRTEVISFDNSGKPTIIKKKG